MPIRSNPILERDRDKDEGEDGQAGDAVVAVQTAASSGAHLTKYSNITDPVTGQKKLIVDEAIVPPASVFDYKITLDSPISLTLDGGLDGIAHAWEVFMGTSGPAYEKVKEVAELCIRLIVYGLQRIKKDKRDLEGRIALGLGNRSGRIFDHARRNEWSSSWKFLSDRYSQPRKGMCFIKSLLYRPLCSGDSGPTEDCRCDL